MIFFDRYIINSEFGCVVGRDCYNLNGDIHQLPITNCTQFEDSENVTVCYNYNLEFLSALGDTGGVLVMTTLMMVLMTKLIICCLKNCCNKCVGCCYLTQILTVLLVLLIGITCVVFIHYYAVESKINTPLRLTGYIFQYIAILLTFSITMLTPWYLLVTPNESLRSCCCDLITQNQPAGSVQSE